MKLLIIDDEESMRHMLSIILKKEGYDVVSAENGHQALKVLEKEGFDFILCDIRMPGIDGLEFLRSFLTPEPRPLTPVIIMMSAYGTIDTAIECMKLGAYDYISKPFKPDEVILVIKKAEERERLKRENIRLKKEMRRGFEDIISQDPRMMEVFDLIKKVTNYNTTVLVKGESGTGKELIAMAIHYNGNRKDKPFVAVNCGAIPEGLLESELFGYRKGAFTDAVRDKKGLFEEADGGTIFLDEVGELPKGLQVKLLRVLQEGEVRMVGDTRPTKVDVRVIAATARDLIQEVKTGNFREDLFYRLNVMPIDLPPLRERQGDIPMLVNHFLERFNRKFNKRIKGIGQSAMDALLNYPWPGNVRELENVMERAVILEETDMIGLKNIPFTQGRELTTKDYQSFVPSTTDLSIKKATEILERELIKRALVRTGSNRTKAASLLGISPRALFYKIKDYKIED